MLRSRANQRTSVCEICRSNVDVKKPEGISYEKNVKFNKVTLLPVVPLLGH